MCACIIPGRFEWKRPRLCNRVTIPFSRFLCFLAPSKNEMKKDQVAAGRWVRNKRTGKKVERKWSQKGDGNFHLIFDAVRTGRLKIEHVAWWVLKQVCVVYWTSRNAKTCLKTSDATRWKSGRVLVKLCEDGLVICSTLLFFQKFVSFIRFVHIDKVEFRLAFLFFEFFLFLMSHIFVRDGSTRSARLWSFLTTMIWKGNQIEKKKTP